MHGSGRKTIIPSVTRKVCRELRGEADGKGYCDEFLQDQLVVFQALAAGKSSFPRSVRSEDEDAGLLHSGHDREEVNNIEGGSCMTREKACEPFGHGSMHSQTARWVVSTILPKVKWWDGGDICEGVGMSFPPS
jgi:RNA 3'-terminal phosphate cyclase (ATP)